ncbi:CRIB domain-containing protein RIC3 [Raphanus sativus]|uniref:CRIB domain-containing protein RIC3-like n=1 Tax=Raphanus sativus TaxID=3726 RepID=A0A6J0KQB3_RAPSA|nr:CRIB domain-containing protein RIC3-like [Raphanus sativus]KAJ4878829.1 CRIB domain-containing protein RIC3 [Raphanus sativus]
MTTTTGVKGFFKGLRHITQIFEEGKERDIQIGFPTDVKHVAHIGSDGPASNAPSWMSDFNSQGNENAQVVSRRDANNNPTGEGVGLQELLPPPEKQKLKKTRRKSESHHGSPPRRNSNVLPSELVPRPSRRHHRSRHASLDSSNDPSLRRRRVIVSANDEEGSNHLSDSSSASHRKSSSSRHRKVKGSGGGEVSGRKTKAKPEKSTVQSDGICNDNNTSDKD